MSAAPGRGLWPTVSVAFLALTAVTQLRVKVSGPRGARSPPHAAHSRGRSGSVSSGRIPPVAGPRAFGIHSQRLHQGWRERGKGHMSQPHRSTRSLKARGPGRHGAQTLRAPVLLPFRSPAVVCTTQKGTIKPLKAHVLIGKPKPECTLQNVYFIPTVRGAVKSILEKECLHRQHP